MDIQGASTVTTLDPYDDNFIYFKSDSVPSPTYVAATMYKGATSELLATILIDSGTYENYYQINTNILNIVDFFNDNKLDYYTVDINFQIEDNSFLDDDMRTYRFNKPSINELKSLGDSPLNGYNNQLLEFNINSNGHSFPVKYVELDVDSVEIPFRFYKFNDIFKINFKPIAKVLLNENNFADEASPTAISSINQAPILANPLFKNILFNLNIVMDGLTALGADRNKIFTKSVTNIDNEKLGYTIEGNSSQLLPVVFGENTKKYKWFVGYPFEIAYYSEAVQTIRLMNAGTNYAGVNADINLSSGVSRIFLDDGLNNIHDNGYLAVQEGLNTINILIDDPESGYIVDESIEVTKVIDACGIFLKWETSNPGYATYLFQNFSELIESESLGSIIQDFGTVSDKERSIIELGAKSKNVLTLYAAIIDKYEVDIIKTLLDSPKIYRYIKDAGTLSDVDSWTDVKQGANSIIVKESGKNKFNVIVVIELLQKDRLSN